MYIIVLCSKSSLFVASILCNSNCFQPRIKKISSIIICDALAQYFGYILLGIFIVFCYINKKYLSHFFFFSNDIKQIL